MSGNDSFAIGAGQTIAVLPELEGPDDPKLTLTESNSNGNNNELHMVVGDAFGVYLQPDKDGAMTAGSTIRVDGGLGPNEVSKEYVVQDKDGNGTLEVMARDQGTPFQQLKLRQDVSQYSQRPAFEFELNASSNPGIDLGAFKFDKPYLESITLKQVSNDPRAAQLTVFPKTPEPGSRASAIATAPDPANPKGASVTHHISIANGIGVGAPVESK